MTDTSASTPIIYDFDPRNLPPELLRAIGLVAAAAAQTESTLQDLIGGLLGIDNVATIALTAQMSGLLKDFVARALIELAAPAASEIDQFDDLLDRVNKAMEKRNTVLHNSFPRHPTTGEVFAYRESARGSLRAKLTPVTVAEIEADAVEIYEAGMAVMAFMMSRGIGPTMRQAPVREPFARNKEARAKRRDVIR